MVYETEVKMDNKNLNSIQSIALPIDTVLHDRYILKKVLSKGGFSITYIAHDKTLNMSTVIKEFMPKDMLERENGTTELIVRYDDMQQDFRKGAENFLDEARILARFADCAGVVSVMDFFAENNTAYIVMPYIQGTTLSEFIPQNGGLSERETIEMLSPVISTLSKVHKAGIIHRDISPDNILITKDKKAILLDFGICLPINDDSKEVVQEKPTSLKHGYAPPEQYCYKGIQGPWTDIYSMAATMYFCIEGKGLMSAVNRMHQQKDIILCCDINPAILKGLNLLSKNRYPDMDAFLKALTEKPKTDIKKKVIKTLAAAAVVFLAFAAGFVLNDSIVVNVFKVDPIIKDNEPATETLEPSETISVESKEYVLLDLDDDDPVPIADANLEAAIRKEINLPEGEIHLRDISEIRTLNMLAEGIKDLDGIQYFTNLTWLDVGNNLISDLTPVTYLNNLNMLRVHGNLIYNISPLETCVSISELDLASNYIEDISPLENLINLTWLDLHSNKVADATAIMHLPKLQWLNIGGNDLGDYTYLAELPRIEELSVGGDEAYAYAFTSHPTLIRFEP